MSLQGNECSMVSKPLHRMTHLSRSQCTYMHHVSTMKYLHAYVYHYLLRFIKTRWRSGCRGLCGQCTPSSGPSSSPSHWPTWSSLSTTTGSRNPPMVCTHAAETEIWWEWRSKEVREVVMHLKCDVSKPSERQLLLLKALVYLNIVLNCKVFSSNTVFFQDIKIYSRHAAYPLV